MAEQALETAQAYFETMEVEPKISEQDVPKTARCFSFSLEAKGEFKDKIPRCYTENTSKEELVLEHVLEYNRQFKIIYDATRELLLCPPNECGQRKFICTTIRPTKLPYTELYDYEGAAKFVAQYIDYEELAEPNKLPQYIPSPANVLTWQDGDSFDFAIALCSILVGVGYDAYVVYGTAPKEITTKDESLMDCPFPLDYEDNMSDEDPEFDEDEEKTAKRKEVIEEDSTFAVEMKLPKKSKFDEETLLRKTAEQKAAERAEVTIDDDEPDYEPDDEYTRQRLHAWVLIQRGARDMMQSIFIEPTTGRKYSLENSPYHSIEAIFNHQNFWVNLDPSREIAELNMDFQKDVTGAWEYVMVTMKKGEDDEEDEEEGGDVGGEELEDEENLDMPPPWSPKLIVAAEKFNDGTKGGGKTLFYKKSKVDFYPECKQVDGLVKRVSLYEDYKRLVVKEIRSYYSCRKDKLVVRRRFPYQFKLCEHYESSAANSYWKKLIHVDGEYRKLYFFHHRNKDHLIYRQEDIGRKTIERYKDREDRMIYRSVTFDPNMRSTGASGSFILHDNHLCTMVSIQKMTQKFSLNPLEDAERQIKRTEFNLAKGRVYLYYHYREGKVTANQQQYKTEDLLEHNKGDTNEKNDEDPRSQILKKIYDMQSGCHDGIKNAEKQSQEELNTRLEMIHGIQQNMQQLPNGTSNDEGFTEQEQNVWKEVFNKILEKSIYEKARDKMKELKKKDVDQAGEQADKDYLAPILRKLSLPIEGELQEEAAISVQNEALRSLKERLLTRAEIIQRRLEGERKKLEEAHEKLSRRLDMVHDNKKSEEDYEKQVADANFRMEILTERASQHYKTSLEKFKKLDEQLQADARLACLRNKGQ